MRKNRQFAAINEDDCLQAVEGQVNAIDFSLDSSRRPSTDKDLVQGLVAFAKTIEYATVCMMDSEAANDLTARFENGVAKMLKFTGCGVYAEEWATRPSCKSILVCLVFKSSATATGFVLKWLGLQERFVGSTKKRKRADETTDGGSDDYHYTGPGNAAESEYIDEVRFCSSVIENLKGTNN